jgi:hypothetical protein
MAVLVQVIHEYEGGVFQGARAQSLVPLEVPMFASFHVTRGQFVVPQAVIDADAEDEEAGHLGGFLMRKFDELGVSGRRIRMSHDKHDDGRLYRWRIVNTWIRTDRRP